MDISSTLSGKSAQLDAIDLADGERTFTIAGVDVKKGADQPVTIHLAEFDRPWKPNLTMRRLLVLGWKGESQQYVGRRITLYREPSIKWSGKEVGGIRIKAMSHLSKTLIATLPINQNQYETFNIPPLKEAPTTPALAPDVLATMSVDELRTHYTARQNAGATPDELAQIAALATENKEN